MIQLEKLVKTFQANEIETTAISDINLHIDAGEFLTIMGPSGCGKSTLMNVLGMIERPDAGRYLFNDIDVATSSERKLTNLRRDNIGFIFQNFNLIDELNVFENVELPLLYLKNMSSEQRTDRVNQLLKRVNISHRSRHFPRQLSGGQQQRVAVARALVADPLLILADEPTGNLDSINGGEVLDTFAALHEEGTTIVMVTHSEDCARIGARQIYMWDGQIDTSQQIGKEVGGV